MTILPFSSADASLDAAGGKGMNLVRLTRAGFAVPPGFIISTEAYREFVSENRWLPEILSGVAGLSAEDASALERTSVQIRVAFSAGKMTEELTLRTNPLRCVPLPRLKTCLIFPSPASKIHI
jgi:pyruvate,water dikinase